MKFFRLILVLFVLLALCPIAPALAVPPPTHMFTVNSIADTGDANLGDGICLTSQSVCTLRAAIGEANALGAGGAQVNVIINLQRDTTYIPAEILSVYANQVLIQTAPGSGARATISSTNDGRAIVVRGESGEPAVLKMYDLRIANGKTLSTANSDSALWLDTVVLENLSSTSSGGAIYNAGHLEMDNCTVRNNSCVSEGGAIYNHYGTFNIQNSTFTGNSAGQHGGAIFNISSSNSAELKHISNSIFENNTTSGYGGAIHINGYNVQNADGSSSVYIQGSRIRNNQAAHGGGIAVTTEYGLVTTRAAMNLANSEVSGNIALSGNGGGIYIANTSSTDLINIENSTISGNEAFLNGGGIYIATDTHSTVTLYNTTITNNAADRLGAQNNYGDGGGYFNNTSSTLKLKNSILAGNRDLSNLVIARIRDCVGALDMYYSLLGNKYLGFCPVTQSSGGNLIGDNSFLDARLGTLSPGSALTSFHTLLPDSPAINAADLGGCYGAGVGRLLTFDQNYEPRPFGAVCDMGAKEYILYPIFLPTILR